MTADDGRLARLLDSAAASVRRDPGRYEAALAAMLATLPILHDGAADAWVAMAEIVVDRMAAAAIEGEIARGAAADAVRALSSDFVRNLLSPQSARRLRAVAEAALEREPNLLDI